MKTRREKVKKALSGTRVQHVKDCVCDSKGRDLDCYRSSKAKKS